MREALEFHAGGRSARVAAVGHQVAAAELDRIEAERLGGEVDEPFRHGGGDGVADGAILAGRRLVLQHHGGLGAVVGKVVGPAHQVGDLVALDRAGARIDRVGADAGQVVDVDGGDAALRVHGHASRDAMVAGVDVAREALQPVGDELDRAAHDLGDHRHRHLVGVDVHLDAVAAADVGADHAHVALGQAQMLGEHRLHHVRRLGGVVHGELGGRAVVVGQDRARLERDARVAARVEGGLDDLVRGLEGVVDLAALVDALEAEVVAELGMDHRRARLQGRLHVDHGGQRRVGDGHLGRGILGDRAAVGDDGCHRLPHPGGTTDRQRVLRRRLHALEVRQRPHPGIAVGGEVLPREHAHHARHRQGRSGVDLDDLRVRVRAAHIGHMHHARQLDVVHVLAAPLHQLGRVRPRHRLADVGVGPVDGAGVDHVVHYPAFPSRLAATVSIASTMA